MLFRSRRLVAAGKPEPFPRPPLTARPSPPLAPAEHAAMKKAAKAKGPGGLCRQAPGEPGAHSGIDQFFDWSTSLFLAIQGIMARSSAPTVSIGCTAFRRRRAVMLG